MDHGSERRRSVAGRLDAAGETRSALDQDCCRAARDSCRDTQWHHAYRVKHLLPPTDARSFKLTGVDCGGVVAGVAREEEEHDARFHGESTCTSETDLVFGDERRTKISNGI